MYLYFSYISYTYVFYYFLYLYIYILYLLKLAWREDMKHENILNFLHLYRILCDL